MPNPPRTPRHPVTAPWGEMDAARAGAAPAATREMKGCRGVGREHGWGDPLSARTVRRAKR
jgi:hypothetical protein